MLTKFSKRAKLLSPALGLILLYVLGVVVRYTLALGLSANPSIMPDESLYANLARSIWTQGSVLMRGQPLNYDSLLYPLVIMPLYALAAPSTIYHLIQLFNALMMNAAVFPAWALAKRITGKSSAAWVVAICTLLLPDLVLTQHIMTESLTFPLLLCTLLVMHRVISDEHLFGDAIGAAALSFLLYFSKPGLIAVGAVFLILMIVITIRSRSLHRLEQTASALLFFIALLAGGHLLTRYILHVDYGFQSIYQTQTKPFDFAHLIQTFNGMLLYLYFFPIATMVLPLAVPLAHAKELSEPNRHFLWVVVLTLLISMIGICYIIYVDEMTANHFANRIHLRYLAGYMPVLLALSLSPSLISRRMNIKMAIIFSFLLAGTLAFTTNALLSNRSYPVDALLLSAMTSDWNLTSVKTLWQFFVLFGLFLAGYLLYSKGWTSGLQRATILVLAACLILHNISGYDLARHNTDSKWASDAAVAIEKTTGAEVLSVTEDGGFFWNAAAALDIRSLIPLPTVELNDLLNNTTADGRFEPFIPHGYWVTHANRMLDMPSWLIMDNAMLSYITLTNFCTPIATSAGCYAMLPITPNQPWVHSALSGLKHGLVQEGSRLIIFDEAIRRKPTITIYLQAYSSSGNTQLTLTVGNVQQTFAITGTTDWIQGEFTVPNAEEPIIVQLSSSGQIYITTYLIG